MLYSWREDETARRKDTGRDSHDADTCEGYVPLTWWNNYAGGGATLGRGLAFLLDPNLGDDPDVAYAIMSTGMGTQWRRLEELGQE